MTRPPGSAIGRYKVLGFMARGQTSIVYRAVDPDSGQEIALKILPPSAMRDPHRVERFLRQADRLASLDHAHLLPILDYGREGGVPFMASPIAPGGSLHDHLDAYRQPALALALVAGLAQAVDYLHRKEIVHGRIGPEHVLLDARGQPLLAGIGRSYPADSRAGSPAYEAPEQRQERAPDAQTDTYQLGALLHHLLLGEPPEPESDPLAAALFAGIDPEVAAILSKALAADPEERFLSAAELAGQLAIAAQQQAGPVATPEPLPDPAPTPAPSPERQLPAIAAPAEPREPEALAVARSGPLAERNPVWLAAGLAALVILIALCCLSAGYAVDAVSSRLRQPRATAQVDTNVRAGPAVEYHIVGLLRAGQQATVHGVSPDGRWWQIAVAGGPDGRGWVPAAFVTVDEMGNVDVIDVPPPTSQAARPQLPGTLVAGRPA